jgi:glucose/arabinose dehydrogenase
VDGYPLSYDVLTWDDHAAAWTATFYEDPGDGSGFAQLCVALHKAR